jgi:HAE1 family hydrophobic/amphiphilic exporter-1
MRAETISIVPNVPYYKMEKILQNTIKQLSIPEGYYIEYGKTFAQKKESIIYMVLYICIAVVLVYMVIASIFESFTVPLIIIPSIPISWIFSLWALYLFNIEYNVATLMGFVVLAGIVVNNAILLIDSYVHKFNNFKKKKLLAFKDYQEINNQRNKPMLITTITTVTGLLPLVISSGGSHLWQGFAITIITGLCGSFVCILIITPVVFNYYQRKFMI